MLRLFLHMFFIPNMPLKLPIALPNFPTTLCPEYSFFPSISGCFFLNALRYSINSDCVIGLSPFTTSSGSNFTQIILSDHKCQKQVLRLCRTSLEVHKYDRLHFGAIKIFPRSFILGAYSSIRSSSGISAFCGYELINHTGTSIN